MTVDEEKNKSGPRSYHLDQRNDNKVNMAEEPEIAVGEEVEAEEEEFVVTGGATEVKLFGKWSFDDIEVRDISLVVSASSVHRMLNHSNS